jgi:hypothetical protein
VALTLYVPEWESQIKFSVVKNPFMREILKAKLPEPGGGCNVERSRMKRAIH